jgi:predicted nucleic acid-binding protein
MRLVVDASVVVAAHTGRSPACERAAALLRSGFLYAPVILRFEAANALRRLEAAGTISGEAAALAHADVLALNVELVPYEPLAQRAWELRRNASIYDGVYVAAAELLEAPLATIDGRLVRAPGARCAFVTP